MNKVFLVSSISLVSLFVLNQFSLVVSVPCNYYFSIGYAEGYCNEINRPGSTSSFIFNCNGNDGTFTGYSTTDCTGATTFDVELDPLTEDFVCGSTDNSCGVTRFEDEFYIETDNCTGPLSTEFFQKAFLIDSIDCTESNFPFTTAFTQSAVPNQGLTLISYTDTACNNVESTSEFFDGDCTFVSFFGGYSFRRFFLEEVEGSSSDSDSSDSSSSESSSSSD